MLIMIPNLEVLAEKALDITAPDHGVRVEFDHARDVLYVHVDGITVLRICRIRNFSYQSLNNPVDRPATPVNPRRDMDMDDERGDRPPDI